VGTHLKIHWAVMMIAALLLSGCFDKLEGGTASATGTRNRHPTISGSPPASIRIGEAYLFEPNASDPDGDTLTFSIVNKPSWAHFDPTTGRLGGTPQEGDASIASNIQITVSDGRKEAALPEFSITVNQLAMGSATLTWLPPTENADGSVLTDLAGYRIYYGRGTDALDQVVTVDNPGLTSYVIDNLSPATWYFSMTSVNSSGVESQRSEAASKTVG
jgi:hypothetical protein